MTEIRVGAIDSYRADDYLDSIPNDDHRRYAKSLIDGVPWPSIDTTGVGERIQDILESDVQALRWGYKPYHYARHRRRVERRVESRKANESYRITRPRDSQRQKVYDAENEAIRHTGRSFGSIEEIQSYVDRLVGSAWWGRRYSDRRIVVQSKHHGTATANYTGSRINLPRWAWTEDVVLHEIAHIATNRQWGTQIPAHGRHFAKVYLELVRHKMGKDAGARLKAAFAKHKVKHSLPRKPMTDEQREAAAARLAAVREARLA